jgi:hypothetical protein
LLTNRNTPYKQITKDIVEFLRAPVKGSKCYRKFFDKKLVEDFVVGDSRSVITFHGLIGLPVPISKILVPTLTLWNVSFFATDFENSVSNLGTII